MEISETNFPDYYFRKYVSEKCDKDDNGSLSKAELESVTSINVSNTTNYKPIASLKGIEHFTKLQKLDFKNQTKVSAIDVSQNPELTSLDCSGTAISELDVSENPKLAWLYCSDTDIASIDVSANTALKQLSCHETNIAELDVSKNTELTGLSASDTALTSLNIENNTKLTSVSLKNTKIEYLDASKNPLITRIDCAGTPIYGIVLAENNKFSKAGKLAAGTFDIEVPSGSFKLADFFEKMDVSRVTAISGGTIKNGIVSEYTGEEPVVCKFVAGNNKLGAEVYLELTLNLTVTPSEEGLEINGANFPDEIFRNYVSEKCDSDGNGKLTEAEIAAVTEINIATGSNWMYKGAKDLTGIEYFTALKKLQCAGSKVTALDVTKNTALEYLQCNGTAITALDVSKNTALKELSCHETAIGKLDLTNNAALETLYCYDTAITALDVSHNPKLVLLSAYKTGIESLDLSQNTELKKVYLSETKLTQLDTSKNEKLEQLDVNDTQMSYLDVSHNAGLLRLDCKNTPLYGLNVGNNKKLMTINKTDSEINLTVPEASSDLKEYFPSIDASKVKIISGAKLDGSVLSGYAQDTLVVYEYNAGKDKKAKILF